MAKWKDEKAASGDKSLDLAPAGAGAVNAGADADSTASGGTAEAVPQAPAPSPIAHQMHRLSDRVHILARDAGREGNHAAYGALSGIEARLADLVNHVRSVDVSALSEEAALLVGHLQRAL